VRRISSERAAAARTTKEDAMQKYADLVIRNGLV